MTISRIVMFLAVGLLLVGTARADSVLADESDANLKWIIRPDARSAAVSKVDDSSPEFDFSFAAVKKGPLELTIRTDADRVSVRLGRRGPRVDLKPNEENTLIVWVGPQPYIELNGERDEDWAEDIARALERDEPETLTLDFGRADGVLLKWRQLPAPMIRQTDDPTEDAVAEDDAPAGDAPQPIDTTALLSRIQNGVIDLRIQRDVEGVVSIVPSPVLTDDHLVVVPAHALRGAKAVTVHVPEVNRPIEAQVVGVDMNIGLALLSLNTTFVPMARAVLEPIPLADAPPAEGEPLFIAARVGGQPRLASMPVEEVVAYNELDKSITSAMPHSPLSQWIQVEGGISSQQSGAPVLNRAGELVGIAAWAWTSRSRSAAVLSATHVQSLIESRKTEPIVLNALDQMTATVKLPRMSFARIETTDDQTAEELRRVTAVLRAAGNCRACDGSGAIMERKRVGYETFGTMRRAIYHNVYDHCAICEGTGLNDAETLKRTVGTVVTAAARLDANADDVTSSFEAVRDALRDLSLGHFQAVAELLNDQAKQTFVGGARKIGQPVVMIGTYIDEVELPGETQHFRGVRIESETRGNETKALVVDPRYVDTAESSTAMITGILAGFIQQEADQSPVPLISHGLVIPIDMTKVVEHKTVEELNEELEAEREEKRAKIEAERQRRERLERERERERDRRY